MPRAMVEIGTSLGVPSKGGAPALPTRKRAPITRLVASDYHIQFEETKGPHAFAESSGCLPRLCGRPQRYRRHHWRGYYRHKGR